MVSEVIFFIYGTVVGVMTTAFCCVPREREDKTYVCDDETYYEGEDNWEDIV